VTYIPTQTALKEAEDTRQEQVLLLKKIELHLSILSGEEIKREDVASED
jgi:hypothetical protein